MPAAETEGLDLSLDAGALIAIERDDRRVRAMCDEVIARGGRIDVVPEVIAQAWRGGERQVHLARFLKVDEVTCPAYDQRMARAVGLVCGASGHADVVDVHVVLHARAEGQRVVTSDAEDLRRVDPTLTIIEI
jgi:hypothetical protein